MAERQACAPSSVGVAGGKGEVRVPAGVGWARSHHASGGLRGPALPPPETHGHDAEEERDQEQDQEEYVVEDDECGGHPEGTALRARTPSRLLTPPTASLLTNALCLFFSLSILHLATAALSGSVEITSQDLIARGSSPFHLDCQHFSLLIFALQICFD